MKAFSASSFFFTVSSRLNRRRFGLLFTGGRIQSRRGLCSAIPSLLTLFDALDTRLSDSICRAVHANVIKSRYLNEGFVGDRLVSAYVRLGLEGDAFKLFDEIPQRDAVSWNSLIAALSRKDQLAECLSVFCRLRRDHFDVEPNENTVLSLLSACIKTGDLFLGSSIHGFAIKTSNVDNIKVDRVAWTIMIASYAVHGDAIGAIELFKEMLKSGIDPDHVTFVHLLNACSHSGLVKEGKEFFNDMTRIYRINPRLEHYSCMVDLLGRSGLLKEAFEMIENMTMEPNAAIWGTLLGACRIHKNVELGRKAAFNLIDLSPCDKRNYLMLCNVYSACGHWEDASKVRHLMKLRGPMVMTSPGYSVLEHGNRVHKFLVADESHPDSDKIYEKLEEVMGKIREAGFETQKEFVLHDVNNDVKEDMLSKHSEKLAIAFGLMVTKPGMPLTIIKNLRICGDCHTMAKFVSRVEERTIAIRDPKRFHHFSDGDGDEVISSTEAVRSNT
ncbi:hypothetical protein V2J09_018079 [Rumex salicifolius]